MKRNLHLFILLFIVGCNPERTSTGLPAHQETETKDSTEIPADNLPLKHLELKIEKANVNFLCDCDSLEFWKGAIQGVQKSDSTGIYCMGQCSSNLDFDIVLFSKKNLELKDCREQKNKKIDRIYDSIPDVEYYAFEIPKTIPLNPENEFNTYEYVYPSEVNVYKKFDDGWYLIRKETINSFEQLGRLKVNTLFKINKPQIGLLHP
ncbi:hypothetical protein BH10BAC1_BH10BAC1_04540 [soil metagenome]